MVVAGAGKGVGDRQDPLRLFAGSFLPKRAGLAAASPGAGTVLVDRSDKGSGLLLFKLSRPD